MEHSLPELDPWPGGGKGGKLGGSGVRKAQPQGCVQIGTLSRAQPRHSSLSSSHRAGWGRWGLSDLLRFTGMSPRARGEEQLQREQWVTANQSRVHQQAHSPSWQGRPQSAATAGFSGGGGERGGV